MAARPHPRLAEVFALLVQSDAEARAAIIDRECAGDAALRRQVERLLVHDAVTEAATAGGFLLDGAPIASAETVVQAFARAMDEDGVAAGGPDEASYAPGTVVERYTIIRPVGAGGFGVVYLARQAPPEERPVALKIMESLPTSPRALRRFEDERHTLAQMDHPNVARIYSGGITARGHPFFAMAFIAGAGPDTPAPRITEYADDRRLSVRERAELFIPVCLAVQHAHQKSIIHRDLKPSNILVAEADGRAMPRIIDFGIARLVDTAGTAGTDGRTLLTLREELLGTPAYMSPEQAGRAPVETRSDVYSLGVVLHELLCGSVPFPFDEKSGPIDVHLRAVREQEPARPSTAMMRTGHAARVAQARGTDPARLVRLLHGDLDTIVLKALEKQPARRYQSAEALAEDLRRHLESQPILARPPTIGYALAKFSRRYRSLVAAAAAVAVALVAATALSLSFGVQARNAERRAHEATGRAEAREATANLLAAWLALQRDNGATVRSRLDLVPRSLRGWEWGHIDFRSDRSVRTLRGHDYLVSALAASRDGTRLVSGDRNGAVLAWDIATDSGQPRRLRPEATDPAHDVWSLAWSPEGDSFATGSLDGTACAWPSDGSKSLREFRDQDGTTYGHVYAVAFSPDGTERQLAVGGGVPGGGSASPGREFGFVALRDLDTGTETWIDDRTHTLPVNDLAFSRDGRWMASGADDGTVCVWSPAGDTPTLRIRLETGGEVNAVAINPAGNL
ncbi:MAG: protein kinase, partial [Phycisphaerales bacterium]|nr:protein kinase [Phycisphaerales bacterium]